MSAATGPSHPTAFEPRLERWITVGTALTLVALCLAALGMMLTKLWIVGAICLLVALMLTAILRGLAWPVAYTVHDDRVAVRSGVLTVDIGWGELERAELVTSALATNTAWSMHRVRLHRVGKMFVDVAPQEREEFLREIERRSPRHAVVDGQLVVSA